MADRVFSYEFRGQFTNLTAGLTAAGKSVSDLGDKMTALDKQGAQYRRGLTTVGDAAGKMGLLAAGGLALATKAAVDWESQWAGVLKTVDGTAKQMAGLEDELRGLARTMPATHEEIAATAEAAGQLGVRRQDVTAFTKTMLQLGETTNLTADEAATSFARFSNIMGTPTSEIDRMGASVVGLGNNFATTEAEVVALSTRLAAAGRQAGLTEADVFGIAAALTSVGVEAEAGGTAMSKVFTSIGDAVRSGDGNLQTFAEVAGVTADEFQRIYENDPSGAIGQFVEGMGGIAREGGNTSAIFKDLGLTDQRLMRAILSVGSATGSWAEATGLANDEYEKNSALTDEFAKRAETSGAKAQVALNNIRDAGIELGDALLPAFAKGAEGVASMAQAFGELPGPAKTAASGLLGITAILGGGLWFTSKVVNGIATTKGALADLGIAADGTAGSLGRVAKTAGTLAAFATIGAGIGAGIAEMTGANLELEDLARNLEAVGQGIENQALNQIIDDLRIVSDRSLKDGIGETVTEIVSLNGAFGTFKTTLDGASSDLEAVDQELARMVESGRGDEAAAIFEAIVAGLNGLPNGASVGQAALDGVIDKFGSYDIALKNTKDSSDGVASKGEAVAGAIGEVGDAAGEAAEDVGTLADALSALLTPKLDLAAATDAWQSGLRNLTDSLADGNRALKGNTDAATQNREAIRGQVSNLLGLVNAQAETGAGSKKLEGQMRRGYDAIIATGKAAGISEGDMRSYLKTLGLTPKEISTIVKAMTKDAEADVTRTQGKVDNLGKTTATPSVKLNTGNALGDIQNIYNSLTNLNGKTATTYIVTKRTVTGGGMGPVGSADGSTVPKDGGSYADRFPYMLAPGEEVISNRRGQADRFRPLLKAINNAADGATVGGMRFPNGGGLELTATARDINALGRAAGSSAKGMLVETRLRGRMLERQSEAVKKELDASKQKLDALKAERDAIKASVDQRLRSDAFAPQDRGNYMELARPENWNELSPEAQRSHLEAEWSVNQSLGFGQTKSPEDIIRADIAAGREMEQILKQLKRKGLSDNVIGDLLDQGGIEMLRAYAEGTRGDIATLNKLYERRDRVLSAASEAGGSFLRDDIRRQNRITEGLREEQQKTNRQLEQANTRLDRIEDGVKKTGPDRITEGVGKAVNGAASNGQRRRNR